MKNLFLSFILLLTLSLCQNYNLEKTPSSYDYCSGSAFTTDIEDIEINDSATQSSITNDTYCKAYFSGLNENFGENYVGSCGYVALGQLLSYYDSFLNDTIIPEQYDVTSKGTETNISLRNNPSPGTLNDTITTEELAKYGVTTIRNLTSAQYFDLVSSKSEFSLHNKLITIGESLNYFGYSDLNNCCSTNATSRKNILNKYLKDIGYSSSDYTIDVYENSYSNNVKNYVRSKIDEGYPVLVSVYSETRGGHAIICYDYNGNNIYANMGWHNSSTSHARPESYSFSTYRNAMVIDFKIEQKLGLNYEVTQNGRTKKYNYNDPSILTYTNKITSFTPSENFDGNLVICKDYVDIENAAFLDCEKLKSVTFEHGSCLQRIGGYAFQQCVNLNYAVIPDSVTTIGWAIFSFCDKLYDVYCQSSGPKSNWDPTWNVKYIDYNAMMNDFKNGIEKDPSTYYTYLNVIWNYT